MASELPADDDVSIADATEERFAGQPLLGIRLGGLRKARGLSLNDVAAGTGISTSFLSLIEKGKSDITINRLMRLATFYQIRVSDLLGEPAELDPYVIRHGDERRIVSPSEGVQMFFLAPAGKTMMPVIGEFERGAAMTEYQSHSGEEFILVLEGRIEVELEGSEPLHLGPGDGAYYKGDRLHSFKNIGKGRARLLGVVSPPSW